MSRDKNQMGKKNKKYEKHVNPLLVNSSNYHNSKNCVIDVFHSMDDEHGVYNFNLGIFRL